MTSTTILTGHDRPRHRVRGVYLLTRETADLVQLCEGVEATLRGGVRIVQYRDKCNATALRRQQAEALRNLTRAHGALLLINDDVALARHCQADGVHLGKHDVSLVQARDALGPDALIGASCYASLERAAAQAEAGADYLAFGAFYPSTTKPAAVRAELSVLQQAERLARPRVAIGGIDAHNARPLIAAGADAIAVLGAVWDAPDIEAAARSLCQLFLETETP